MIKLERILKTMEIPSKHAVVTNHTGESFPIDYDTYHIGEQFVSFKRFTGKDYPIDGGKYPNGEPRVCKIVEEIAVFYAPYSIVVRS